MKKNSTKTIWITGASSGIGEALVYSYDKRKYNLILSSRNRVALEKVKNNCSNKEQVYILPLDLLQPEEFLEKTKEAITAFGGVDILINNAGVSQRSLIEDTDLVVYKKLMDINYLGTIALTKALLPHFIQQKSGTFVTVTSLMGKFSSPYRSGYCGVKHALHGFFDALRLEQEKNGIRVTLICPGFVQTNVSINAFVGDGQHSNKDDEATQNGLLPSVFAARMIKAIDKNKMEAYIGKKEVLGIYLKRFFPSLLHKIILRSKVR
ncbi:MAG: SDR family oxidoreductase [Aureispira sp.]